MTTSTERASATHEVEQTAFKGVDSLSPAALEKLRREQKGRLDQAIETTMDDDSEIRALNEESAHIRQGFSDYLEQAGIPPEDPRYREYLDHLEQNSYLEMSDSEWRFGVPEGQRLDDSEKELPESGRDKAAVAFEGFQRSFVSDTPKEAAKEVVAQETREEQSTPETELSRADVFERFKRQLEGDNSPEAQGAREALAALEQQRIELAGLTAKEMGKPFSVRSKRYHEARAAYDVRVIEVGQLIDRHLAAGDAERTLDDRRADALYYLVGEQNTLRAATRERFLDTKTSKFVKWFQEGSKAQKIAKALAVGAPFALIGLVAAPATAVGAGIVGAGLGAARFARGAAARDRRDAAMQELTDADKRALAHEIGSGTPDTDPDIARNAAIARAGNQAGELFDRDKKKEQTNRRKAVAWGVGGVAVGTLAGLAISEVGDHISNSRTPNARVLDPGPETIDPTPSGDEPGKGDSIQIPDGEAPTVVEPTQVEAVETFSDGALHIRNGEGWYETFMELGISAENRDDLLPEVGPTLYEMRYSNGVRVAYFDNAHQEWRINMSPDGHMPKEALQYITDTARDKGYLPELTSTVEPAPEVAGTDTAADAAPNQTPETTPVEEAVEPGPEVTAEEAAEPRPEVTAEQRAQDEINRFNRDAVDPKFWDDMSRVGVATSESADQVVGDTASAQELAGESSEAVSGYQDVTVNSLAGKNLLNDLGLSTHQWQEFYQDHKVDLQALHYDNGQPVITESVDGTHVHVSPEGDLHPELIDAIEAARNESRDRWALAS